MTIYPNQNIVHIKKSKSDKDNIYSPFNIEATFIAMKSLSYSGFMLYSYLNMNANDYKLALSMADVLNKTSIKRTVYFKCVEELKEKGFLVLKDNKTKEYLFFEHPILSTESELHSSENELVSTEFELNSTENGLSSSESDREIIQYNINNITNIDEVSNSKNTIQKEKEAFFLSNGELKSMPEEYKNYVYISEVDTIKNHTTKEIFKYVVTTHNMHTKKVSRLSILATTIKNQGIVKAGDVLYILKIGTDDKLGLHCIQQYGIYDLDNKQVNRLAHNKKIEVVDFETKAMEEAIARAESQ